MPRPKRAALTRASKSTRAVEPLPPLPIPNSVIDEFLQNVRTDMAKRNTLVRTIRAGAYPKFEEAVQALSPFDASSFSATDVYNVAQQRYVDMMHCCFMKEAQDDPNVARKAPVKSK